MRPSVLRDASNGTIVATGVARLNGFIARLTGLLGRSSIGGAGVWIPRCHAIHTIGMRFAIDVAFVDARGTIVRLVPDVRPNVPALTCRTAVDVVEVAAGAFRRGNVVLGDRLELIEPQRRAVPPAHSPGAGDPTTRVRVA
jgi:uncharacterized membrane protein (UPF0127 family)